MRSRFNAAATHHPNARSHANRSCTLALFFALALPLVSACAPENVDMNIHDIFSGDAARYALQTQMSPTLLASVGGFLPQDSWPAGAAPLIVDVKVVAENKIDLSTSNLDLGSYSGMRLHWAQLIATTADGSPLNPLPGKVELYVGPAGAASYTDVGVVPLAAGAFPSSLAPADCDAGDCISDAGAASMDAGPGDADGGCPICNGGINCPPCAPPDAGVLDAGPADAGTSSGSSSTNLGQTLVFSSEAQQTLETLVFAGQPFALFVVVHLPIDSQVNPAMPTGGVDLSFDVQFELAR